MKMLFKEYWDLQEILSILRGKRINDPIQLITILGTSVRTDKMSEDTAYKVFNLYIKKYWPVRPTKNTNKEYKQKLKDLYAKLDAEIHGINERIYGTYKPGSSTPEIPAPAPAKVDHYIKNPETDVVINKLRDDYDPTQGIDYEKAAMYFVSLDPYVREIVYKDLINLLDTAPENSNERHEIAELMKAIDRTISEPPAGGWPS